MEEWEEIHGFGSPGEFARFQQWIEGVVMEGVLKQVEVEERYGSEMYDERWYRSRSGETWRLVAPDFPFKGVFARVESAG